MLNFIKIISLIKTNRMTKTALFYYSTSSLIIGSLSIGLGIGKLFDKACEGTLIGIGVGLILTAINSFRIYKKLLAFNKDNV